MRKSVFACLSAMVLCLTACAAQSPQAGAQESFFAMDTYITITAYGEDTESALSQAKDKITALERLWSVTDAHSEIYAVNHAGGRPVTVSRETADILAFALDMARKTDGALEPTIYPVLRAWGFTTGENRIPPDDEIRELLGQVGYDKVMQDGNTVRLSDGMMLDLGAVGKGYGGDAAVELLKENGITSALLDIGGNIQAIGGRPAARRKAGLHRWWSLQEKAGCAMPSPPRCLSWGRITLSDIRFYHKCVPLGFYGGSAAMRMKTFP